MDAGGWREAAFLDEMMKRRRAMGKEKEERCYSKCPSDPPSLF